MIRRYFGPMFNTRIVPVVALGCSVLLVGATAPLCAQGGGQGNAPGSARENAPAASTPALDLAAALRLAREAGPLRQVADARRQIGLGRVTETNQWGNPSLEWRRENLGSSLQPDIFATLYLPFDLSGKRFAQRQAAAAGRDRVARDGEADRRAADLDVARAWLRAAVAQGSYEVVSRQVDALREIARVDAERLREGLVSEAVGLRTSLEADRARVQLVTAQHEANQARATLARLLALPDGNAPEITALVAPALPVAPDSVRARAAALAARPELQARESAVLEAQRRLAVEQRAVFGEVQLQGGTKETSGFMTGQVGIAMPMPLFNRNSGARQRAAGELNEARVLRDDMRLAVATAAASAWANYVQVQRTAADAATFDARGREVARIARLSYREGHVTLTELLDAERAAADAMQAHLRWAADAWIARLELERAIGARLDESSPLDLPLFSSLPTGR